MFDLSSTVRRGHPIAFGIFALTAFIVAVIASAVVANFNAGNQPQSSMVRDSARFLVFAGWWGFIFSLVYVRALRSPKNVTNHVDCSVLVRCRWFPLVDRLARCLYHSDLDLLARRYRCSVLQGRQRELQC